MPNEHSPSMTLTVEASSHWRKIIRHLEELDDLDVGRVGELWLLFLLRGVFARPKQNDDACGHGEEQSRRGDTETPEGEDCLHVGFLSKWFSRVTVMM